MIRDAYSADITSRKATDQAANEAVRNGDEQFASLLEANPNILDGLTWFQSEFEHCDQMSVETMSKENRAEHVDAWALQRDVNYAYSDRKRLFDIGHDSRFEEAYQAGFLCYVQNDPRA